MNNGAFIKPLVNRKKTKIERDTSRVIARSNIPDMSRIRKIINRVLGLTEEQAENLLHEINFIDRHKNIELQFEEHFNNVLEFGNKPIHRTFIKTYFG